MENSNLGNMVKGLVIKASLIMCLMFSLGVETWATPKDSLSTMQLKKYERIKLRADKFYEDFGYAKSIGLYQKALLIVDEDDSIRVQIASAYYQMHNLDSAGYWYDQVIEIDSLISDETHYLNYAEVQAGRGNYPESKVWFERYLMDNPEDTRVKARIQGLDQLLIFYRDSMRFSIKHEYFNSDTYDFSPVVYEDELLFVSARETSQAIQFLKPKYKWDQTYFLNLMKIDSSGEAEVFNRRIKTGYHEGPTAFYDDGKKVIFTRNNYSKGELRISKKKVHVKGAEVNESKEGINKLKLFYAEKLDNGNWNTPVELWFNSDEHSTGHPTVSADGQRLYFASDREGGKGKTDIYRCINYDGIWGNPENLGSVINTEGNEMFPFVDENEILYFASDGHEGLGGLDLFKVDMKKHNAVPVNMGYPLNSSMDDFGIFAWEDDVSQTGYFSSNRTGGMGLDDIYKFSFEKRLGIPGKVIDKRTGLAIAAATVSMDAGDGRVFTDKDGMFDYQYNLDLQYVATGSKDGYTPATLSFSPRSLSQSDTIVIELVKERILIEGIVTDSESGNPLDSTVMIVSNGTTGEKFGIRTGASGQYSFLGDASTQYDFTFRKSRYFTQTSTLNTSSEKTADYRHDAILEEIIIGKPIELNDIHFDLAKWDIRSDAALELDKFTKQLTDNPAIIVELSTHTDSRGTDSYNYRLSDRRAKSAAQYVIDSGIPEKRLVGQGYGETQLLNECDDGVECDEDQHQRNRRAEFKVTGFLPDGEYDESEQGILWISADYMSSELLKQNQENLKSVGSSTTGDLSVAGKVLDSEGNPVAGAQVSLLLDGSNSINQVQSSDDGSFKLNTKSGQTYKLVVVAEGYYEAGEILELGAEDYKDVIIELERK